MFRHLRPVWAEINLDKIAYNMKQIRKATKSKDIIAVVKADAYGHGAVDIVPTLLENGATRLAVAVVNEAVEIRRSGIQCPILILGYTPISLADNLLKYDIEQTVFNYEYAKKLSEIAKRKNKIAKIHIAVDTGMGRIGFYPNKENTEQVYKINQLSNISIEGIFTHFSTADEEDKQYTYYQLEKYNWFYNELKEKKVQINIRHIANSAAIIDLPQTNYDAVRPGIIIYGYYPSNEVNKRALKLQPAMMLKTNVVHIKEVEKGQTISYGRKYKADKKRIIATLPVGYADGYTRQLCNKAKVIINGQFAPVIGTICMDQCMVDVTNIENIKIGNEVILMGEDNKLSMNADDMANLLDTINYEIICMIGKRVPRVYIKDDKVVKVRNYI